MDLSDLLSRYLQSMMSAFAYPGMPYPGRGAGLGELTHRVCFCSLDCRWLHYRDAADAQLQKRCVRDNDVQQFPARNIPNRYTRDMLIARLDKGYKAHISTVGAVGRSTCMLPGVVHGRTFTTSFTCRLTSAASAMWAMPSSTSEHPAPLTGPRLRCKPRFTFLAMQPQGASKKLRFHTEFHGTKTKCCAHDAVATGASKSS